MHSKFTPCLASLYNVTLAEVYHRLLTLVYLLSLIQLASNSKQKTALCVLSPSFRSFSPGPFFFRLLAEVWHGRKRMSVRHEPAK
jgi:hypothetical protein